MTFIIENKTLNATHNLDLPKTMKKTTTISDCWQFFVILRHYGVTFYVFRREKRLAAKTKAPIFSTLRNIAKDSFSILQFDC